MRAYKQAGYVSRKLDKLSLKYHYFPKVKRLTVGKTGLEIGGPSHIFSKKGQLPIYSFAHAVDGCNFSNNTVWENLITEGDNYNYEDQTLGYQYIKDATDLEGIDSEEYDFVLSSHSLEHIANPIKAIEEWLRVLKRDGFFLLIVPDKNYTFDHKRSYTKFEHLVDDYDRGTTERDLTHLEEILSLHDLSLDTPAGNIDQFKKRSYDNYINRCLHQHVFDFKLLEQIFHHFKLKIVFKKSNWPFHLMIMGKKQ
jgi:SAM-dependent methyltransferase